MLTMPQNIYDQIKLKNILYAPKSKRSGSPVFYLDKSNKTYAIKSFVSLELAQAFVQFLMDSSKDSQHLEAESFTIEDLLMYAKGAAPKTNNTVLVEVWGENSTTDYGPFILYDSTETLN